MAYLILEFEEFKVDKLTAIDYVNKHGIISLHNLAEDLSHVSRDLNKAAKLYPHRKRKLYDTKHEFMRFLKDNGFLKEINTHRYGKDLTVLFTTIFKKGDGTDELISYHTFPRHAKDLGVDSWKLEEKPASPNKKSYTSSDIKNIEKVDELVEIIDDLNDPKTIESLEKLFSEL